jgi:hypothetical protein
MRFNKWIGVAAAVLMIVACFMPWIVIEGPHILVSGINAEGTNFGKPGYFNLLMTIFFLFFHLTPRVWAKRANLAVIALNLAWAIRNYFLLSTCRAGDCPTQKTGLYLHLFAAVIMLFAGLFPDMKLPQEKNK